MLWKKAALRPWACLQPWGERALTPSSSWPSLPAGTSKHHGALGALASVPWSASHWDSTGSNTELQPASRPATRCPQEMIVLGPVCAHLFTALEQMQPLSCPAHRLCPSWPCFLMICFSIPQWKQSHSSHYGSMDWTWPARDFLGGPEKFPWSFRPSAPLPLSYTSMLLKY